jgi:hypothetical protein
MNSGLFRAAATATGRPTFGWYVRHSVDRRGPAVDASRVPNIRIRKGGLQQSPTAADTIAAMGFISSSGH